MTRAANNSDSAPTQVFISHNKADKDIARSLALALIDQGVGVWFDEWNLKPGDSITEGIEGGIAAADLVVVVWSENAAKSKWIKAELHASIYRRVSDGTVRVVPLMLDDTPLPALVADSRGFRVHDTTEILEVASKITGDSTPKELARRLQNRFFEMLDSIGGGVGSSDYRFCPRCGSTKLEGWQATDDANDRMYAGVRCKDCHWEDGGEV